MLRRLVHRPMARASGRLSLCLVMSMSMMVACGSATTSNGPHATASTGPPVTASNGLHFSGAVDGDFVPTDSTSCATQSGVTATLRGTVGGDTVVINVYLEQIGHASNATLPEPAGTDDNVAAGINENTMAVFIRDTTLGQGHNMAGQVTLNADRASGTFALHTPKLTVTGPWSGGSCAADPSTP